MGIQLEGLSTNKIRRGFVCGNLYDDPPHEVKQITAQVYHRHVHGRVRCFLLLIYFNVMFN